MVKVEGPSELDALAALKDPLRSEVYRYVAGRQEPAGREEVATALDLPRSVAAFHLDKLASAGLLDVEYRRPPGRSGPGAGRPAKLYRRSGREFSVSVPDRSYDLAGLLLAESVASAHADGADPIETAQKVSRAHGVEVGRRRPPVRPSSRGGRQAVVDALREEGYEPRVEGRTVVLSNCPFHRLADRQRNLICGMNLELVSGLIEGMGVTGLQPCLRPAPDRCCVVVDT